MHAASARAHGVRPRSFFVVFDIVLSFRASCIGRWEQTHDDREHPAGDEPRAELLVGCQAMQAAALRSEGRWVGRGRVEIVKDRSGGERSAGGERSPIGRRKVELRRCQRSGQGRVTCFECREIAPMAVEPFLGVLGD